MQYGLHQVGITLVNVQPLTVFAPDEGWAERLWHDHSLAVALFPVVSKAEICG
jgi:hypothetical protein